MSSICILIKSVTGSIAAAVTEAEHTRIVQEVATSVQAVMAGTLQSAMVGFREEMAHMMSGTTPKRSPEKVVLKRPANKNALREVTSSPRSTPTSKPPRKMPPPSGCPSSSGELSVLSLV